MDILYIKYGLIALGVVATLVVFIAAIKMLGPPTFREYGTSSQKAGKELTHADLVRLNKARNQAHQEEFTGKFEGRRP